MAHGVDFGDDIGRHPLDAVELGQPGQEGGPAVGDMAQWASVAQRMQALWLEFQRQQAETAAGKLPGRCCPIPATSWGSCRTG
jgi:hypothetical protein